MNEDPTWRVGWTNEPLDPGTYTVTVNDVDDTQVQVTSTADVHGVTRTVSSYFVNAPVQIPPFNYAIFGRESVTMTGNSFVNSYDSSVELDPHDDPRPNGDVATNATGSGVISLNPNSFIDGDAFAGPGATPGIAISAGGGQISGSRSTLAAEVDFPSVEVPPTATALGDIILSGNSTLIIPAGEYHATSIQTTGNSRIRPAGVVFLYVTGDIKISGKSSWADGFRTHDLAIYGTDDCTSVSVSGNGTYYGTIYAPNADMTLKGGGSNGIVCGAVVAKTVKMNGVTDFHYDESLADYTDQPMGSSNKGYTQVAFWEGN